jgi:hypothetical protein
MTTTQAETAIAGLATIKLSFMGDDDRFLVHLYGTSTGSMSPCSMTATITGRSLSLGRCFDSMSVSRIA